MVIGLANLPTLVEKNVGRVLHKLRATQGLTYDRLSWDMQTGMFGLSTHVPPVLYEPEWKPGPYRPDLWV
jgi:hypothetical protein